MAAVTSVTYQVNINGNYTKTMESKRGLRQGDPMSPLLFVLVMEYLNRCLKRLKQNLDFNFHSKCERLNITNLCFIDDLLLFSRGNVESVNLMMNAFKVFSNSTGVKVNPAKYCILFGGVNQKDKDDVKELTGFKEGALSFRYLGIHMTSKRLNVHHYSSLIDKITSKITH